jgi:hypothetical protein
MNASLMMNSKSIVGYSNVSYENLIPSYYTYRTPEIDVTYYIEWTSNYAYSINGFENLVDGVWYSFPTYFYNFPTNTRKLNPESWTLVSEYSNLTISQWNNLQQDVANGTKRNLVGTPIYS